MARNATNSLKFVLLKFVSIHPLAALLAVVSVAVTLVAGVALRRSWPRRVAVARMAMVLGWTTIIVYCLLGFEMMTFAEIAATRSGITNAEIQHDHRVGETELLVAVLVGILLGGPAVLIRRIAAPAIRAKPNGDA